MQTTFFIKKIGGYLLSITSVFIFFVLASYSNTFPNVLYGTLTKFLSFFITGFLLRKFFSESERLLGIILFIGLIVFVIWPLNNYRLNITIPAYFFCVLGLLLGLYIQTLNLRAIILYILGVGILLLINKNYIYPSYVSSQLNRLNSKTSEKEYRELEEYLKSIPLAKGNDFINLSFNRNKVYLIEFFFDKCPPCKVKDKFLMELENTVNDNQFEIIYIESGKIDDVETYRKNLLVKKNLLLYDTDDSLINKMKITVFPFEIIVGRDGKIRFMSSGFDKGTYGETYISETKKKINTLLNEK